VRWSRDISKKKRELSAKAHTFYWLAVARVGRLRDGPQDRATGRKNQAP